MFFAEEIRFDYPGEKITQREISEIDDFPGREDFIAFYTAHNGGDFIDGAWFFPEDGYNVSAIGKSYITLSLFLEIYVENGSADGRFRALNQDVMKYLIEEKYEGFEDFILFHIPFALDQTENPFWIDIQTGEIRYTDFEVSTNPDEAVTVASSFKSFCERIRKRNI